MYKNIGVNKNKQHMELMRKTKMPKRPSGYYNYVRKFDIYEDLDPDYTFEDMEESVIDCLNSNEDECFIKSCILNKKYKINKNLVIAAGASAVAAGIGLSILGMKKSKKKCTKRKTKSNLSKYAPTLVRVATKLI